MSILFQDQFEVKEVSKKFDRGAPLPAFFPGRRSLMQALRTALAVARISCRLAEEGYEMGLDLDYNSDLFSLEINDRFVRRCR